MEFRYVNNYTGQLYRNMFHAIREIIFDMKNYPKCRTIKMLNVSKLKGEVK